jgi:hypothetical protein
MDDTLDVPGHAHASNVGRLNIDGLPSHAHVEAMPTRCMTFGTSDKCLEWTAILRQIKCPNSRMLQQFRCPLGSSGGDPAIRPAVQSEQVCPASSSDV